MLQFAATTLCICSMLMFIFVHINYNPQFSKGRLEGMTHFCDVYFRLWKTISEMLKTAFGSSTMGRTQSCDWFAQFRREVEGCEHLGHCSTGCRDENMDKVCKILNEDQSTISEMACRLILSHGTCQ
jgi:hypothetical protein